MGLFSEYKKLIKSHLTHMGKVETAEQEVSPLLKKAGNMLLAAKRALVNWSIFLMSLISSKFWVVVDIYNNKKSFMANHATEVLELFPQENCLISCRNSTEIC